MNVPQMLKSQVELANAGFSSTAMDNLNGGSYVNKRVAICKDVFFGLCVWDGERWVPLSDGSVEEIRHIWKLIDMDPNFQWVNEFEDTYKQVADRERRAT